LLALLDQDAEENDRDRTKNLVRATRVCLRSIGKLPEERKK
jgi:hypothetical protein